MFGDKAPPTVGRNEYSAKCLQHNGSAVWLGSDLSSNMTWYTASWSAQVAVITSQRFGLCNIQQERKNRMAGKRKQKVKTSNVAAPDDGATTGYEAELWAMADALRGPMCCA